MLPLHSLGQTHDIVTVQSTVSDECRMLTIGGVHEYLVVSRIGVHEAQQLVTSSYVHELVDPGQQEAMLRTGLTHSPPSFALRTITEFASQIGYVAFLIKSMAFSLSTLVRMSLYRSASYERHFSLTGL
ncbi:hypothetical protein L3X38_042221 [Prunus dulcis]|uniref:Uncharacterized protein n=1 Tax=Prunus dulcis TaxID=3755 RepID=A0AAD4UW55_PRUDU|nr:hypothetical protein L3X38_042221 [Prunus dulcis]